MKKTRTRTQIKELKNTNLNTIFFLAKPKPRNFLSIQRQKNLATTSTDQN